IHRDLLREVAARDGGGDLGDVAHLAGQVPGHRVHGVGQVLPGAGDALDVRLAAELALRSYFPRHAGDFRSVGGALIDQDVDGVFQLQDLALGIRGDLLGEVAPGDGGSDFRDVPDLVGQVGCHRVHGIGEVLPGTRHPLHFRLAAQFALGAYFAGHAGNFG